VTPGWANKLVTVCLPRLLPRSFLADQMARVQAR
jgi:hypothetical protein